MEHPYSTAAVTFNKQKGTATGELLEHGVRIAKYSYNRQNWPQLTIKFGSSQSQARFDDFCDSLSMAETIEAIGGLYK